MAANNVNLRGDWGLMQEDSRGSTRRENGVLASVWHTVPSIYLSEL